MSPSARSIAAAVIVALCLSSPSPAGAHAPRNSAAEHVAAANRAYQAKSYDRALAELRQAYQLAPRPEFLLTFAQIYRAAGQLQPALEACNSYLATVPDGPMSPGARKLAETLRNELAARTPAPGVAAAPAAVAVEPTATPSAGPTPPAPASVALTATPPVSAPGDDAAGTHRRRWIIGLSVGLGAAAILAVGLGVGLGIHHDRPSTYGTIDFSH